MADRNWVELGAKVLTAGVAAAVPGSAVVAALAVAALGNQKAQLEGWFRNRQRAEEYAAAVKTWSQHQRPSYGDATIEIGMAAAADILLHKGAALSEIAAWGLDPTRITSEVMARDTTGAGGLPAGERAVCAMAVRFFYERLVYQGPPELEVWVRRELLERSRETQVSLDHLDSAVEALPDRVVASMGRVPPLTDRDLKSYLAAVRDELDRDLWTYRAGGQVAGVMTLGRWSKARAWIDTGYVPGGEGHDQGAAGFVDVDELIDSCERLVLLGLPGSGKSWFARRCAMRAAEMGRSQLEGGQDSGSIEVPLFARYTDFVACGGRWPDFIDAAVDGVGASLEGDRSADAVRKGLKARQGPFLVVLDGLDEAEGRGDDDILDRLVRSRAGGLRVVLTSRAASWRRQLELRPDPAVRGGKVHRLAELAPLRYPEDVHGVIESVLGKDSARTGALIEVLNDSPELAEASTTPLICMLYCLLAGGDSELPRQRSALFERVVTRLVAGGWHAGDGGGTAVAEAARMALRGLASASAVDDPFSGLGAWPDVVSETLNDSRPAGVSMAMSHVAPEVPYHPDLRGRHRRFVHRALREHLLAEFLAGLAPIEAAERMEPHLWYDPEWRTVIPAVLALHPRRDVVLARLLTGREGVEPGKLDVSRRDGFGELRRLLTELATMTTPDQWGARSRALIDGRNEDLEAARQGWHGSLSKPERLRRLVDGDLSWTAPYSVLDWISALGLGVADKRRITAALVGRLQEGAPIGRSWPSGWEVEAASALGALGVDEAGLQATVEAIQARLRLDPTVSDARALVVLSGGPAPRSVVDDVLARFDAMISDPPWTDHYAIRLLEVLEEAGAGDEVLSRCAVFIGDRLGSGYEGAEDDPFRGRDRRGLILAIARYGDDEQRASAIDLLLRRARGMDSSRKEQHLALIKRLFPDHSGGTVLRHLCQVGGPWENRKMAGEVLTQLAASASGGDVQAATGELRGRIERSGIDQNLYSLSHHFSVLDPGEADCEAAAASLLERLPETPNAVIGSLVLPLREIGVTDEQRNRVIEDLVRRMDRIRDDPGLMVQVVRMICWFHPPTDTQSRVIAVLVEIIRVAREFDYHMRIAVRELYVSLEDRSQILDALVGRVEVWRAREVEGLAYDMTEWAVSSAQREQVVEALARRLSATDDLDDAETLMEMLWSLQAPDAVQEQAVRMALALASQARKEMRYRRWIEVLPGGLTRDETSKVVELLLPVAGDEVAFDQDRLSLMEKLGPNTEQDARITDWLVAAMEGYAYTEPLSKICEAIMRRKADYGQRKRARQQLIRVIGADRRGRLDRYQLAGHVRSLRVLGITASERREVASILLAAARAGDPAGLDVLPQLEPYDDDTRREALLLKLDDLGEWLGKWSLSPGDAQLLAQLRLDGNSLAEYARTAQPDESVLRALGATLRRTISAEDWYQALERLTTKTTQA